MSVDYNNFAKSFAESRKNMKWPELEYFFTILWEGSILDLWCGSGRFIESYNEYFWYLPEKYTWVDMSSGLIQEGQARFPDQRFLVWDMLEIDKLLMERAYENIFLIASFHHLDSLEKREKMMQLLYSRLQAGWKIYMTNWALDSSVNFEKYMDSRIPDSWNEFESYDYNIKFGDFDRYYHCFHLLELEYLAKKVWFSLMENRLFEWEKNIITILQK